MFDELQIEDSGNFRKYEEISDEDLEAAAEMWDELMLEYECPTCSSQAKTSLGFLGMREYFRCRNCGIDYSIGVNK